MESLKAYLKDIKKIPLLSAQEEKDLARKIKEGDVEARMKMIKANLRLVVSIAKRYSHFGVPLIDLIEEGNIGLMKAVSMYDPKQRFRFSTYAAYWIRQYITRALANQAKTVRVPVYMVEAIAKWKRAVERLTQKLGRRPRLKEVAKEMKESAKKIKQIRSTITRITSLEAPIGKDGTGQFVDLIPDESSASAVDEIAQVMREESVDELLEKMSAREREVLSLRYGLKNGTTHTLNEIAKEFGITRERVRQIEEAAMRKLRAYVESKRGETNE
ncbi:MAG: sigma-70 family RNA polymerase sigma factor [Candidatus Omnitrophota bacterium]|nr:MAG: sigma-70 family RNA polymerase sigma factor [Candidatus Omnitrophota bacterium]